MLRNRTYLGEVSFQSTHHPAPHEPLVDKDLFERVQEILGECSEDISLRRSNQSEYLATAVTTATTCASPVSFSRQRYGKKACEGERLPADQLEEAILDQLLAVLEREPMVREAISEAFAELDADQPKREAELERIDAERRRTSESLERYFRAFEEGTMPESACAPRIGELSEKLRGLEARREELAAEEPRARAAHRRGSGVATGRGAGSNRGRRPADAQGAAAIAGRRDQGRRPRGDLPVFLFACGSTTTTSSTATGIRTPVSGLRIRRPSPLDDSGARATF
jgi:Recombinase